MGHADFYPNNQTRFQPHCIVQTSGCAHQSVIEYYKSAVNPNNRFIGRSCDGNNENRNSVCRFGPQNQDDCRGIYCFNTSLCAPFAL